MVLVRAMVDAAICKLGEKYSIWSPGISRADQDSEPSKLRESIRHASVCKPDSRKDKDRISIPGEACNMV